LLAQGSCISHKGCPVELIHTYSLNPLVTYHAHKTHLTPINAADIVSRYDIVLDCTDHPTSRYLISDICVLLAKPLVSASALRTDGQLIVLNCPPVPRGSGTEHAQAGGPCYRCVFPKPPPPDSVMSCGEGGILGPVVGVMGVLQALEALRIIASGRHVPPSSHTIAGSNGTNGETPSTSGSESPPPNLLLFSATGTGPLSFRSVRMRGKRKDCFACGAGAPLTLAMLASGSLDYVQFCGAVAPVAVLAPDERVSVRTYQQLRDGDDGGRRHVLLDVREKELFEAGGLEGALNVPFSVIQGAEHAASAGQDGTWPEWVPKAITEDKEMPVYIVCRVGNDSQIVTRKLKDLGLDRGGRFIGDIQGGMRAWKAEVDSTMPFL